MDAFLPAFRDFLILVSTRGWSVAEMRVARDALIAQHPHNGFITPSLVSAFGILHRVITEMPPEARPVFTRAYLINGLNSGEQLPPHEMALFTQIYDYLATQFADYPKE